MIKITLFHYQDPVLLIIKTVKPRNTLKLIKLLLKPDLLFKSLALPGFAYLEHPTISHAGFNQRRLRYVLFRLPKIRYKPLETAFPNPEITLDTLRLKLILSLF